MKRFALMISLLLSILCMTQAKDRIVERPTFLAQPIPYPEGNRHYAGQRVLDARVRRSRIPINFPPHSSKRDLPGFL